jgi:alkylhydroperoxidase family enzyme
LPKDPRYAALSVLTKALIENKGNVTDEDIDAFTSAGYSKAQILEVVAGIGVSTMAATTTNLAGTPIEERFQPQAWSPALAKAA